VKVARSLHLLILFGLPALVVGCAGAGSARAQDGTKSQSGPTGFGFRPVHVLEFDEEAQVTEQSLNGPYSGDWEFTRRGKVRLVVLRQEGDGTFERLRAWKREVPVLSKYHSNQGDVREKFGKTFAQQLHVEPFGLRHERVKPTGNPLDPHFPDDLEAALDAVFERCLLLPGGLICVGDKGDWTERIGPLNAKFEWEVVGRENRAGRPCLVYEVRPSAVLAVKAESLPNFMGTIVWHSGKDEGYLTTKGSTVRTWLAVADRVPIAYERDEKIEVVPQRYVGQYRHTVTKLTLAQENALTDADAQKALAEADAVAAAEDLATAAKPKEALDAYARIAAKPGTWQEHAAARVQDMEALLPIEGQACPPLPEGEWVASAPKTIEDLKGKVLLLDIWLLRATPCFETMKTVKALAKKYADRGLAVVGMTCAEPWEETGAIHDYLGRALIDYPTLIAGAGFSDKRFQIEKHGIPYSLLVDREGTIRWAGTPADATTLEAEITKLLGEK